MRLAGGLIHSQQEIQILAIANDVHSTQTIEKFRSVVRRSIVDDDDFRRSEWFSKRPKARERQFSTVVKNYQYGDFGLSLCGSSSVEFEEMKPCS